MTKTHGFSGTRPYHIWDDMISRCYRVSNKSYPRYGGRGIVVTPSWRTFDGFWEEMKTGYADNLSIDRIDNNGDYTLNNCRWATRTQQNLNRRDTLFVEYLGKKCTLKEACEIAGKNFSMVRQRLNRYHWSIERSLSIPSRIKNKRRKL
jgi:hypothetical protein